MTKANPINTTPTDPDPIPSVFMLGRHFLAARMDVSHYDRRMIATKDGARVEYKDASASMDLAHTESEALHSLILARPIETLADALTLAIHCFQVAESCDSGAEAHTIETDVDCMQSAFARIALVLAEAAARGLDAVASPRDAALIRRRATGRAVQA
jgi:hypothetical protein